MSEVKNGGVHDGDARSVADAVASQSGFEIPSEASSPYAVKAWWSSLSEGEQQDAINSHSEQIGSLVGVPPGARHQANLRNLDSQLEYWQTRYSDLRADLVGDPHGNARLSRQDSELLDSSEEKQKLDDLIAIRNSVIGPGGKSLTDRYLLQVKSHDEPVTKAIVADGDISRATNISMTVPGYTTNPRDSLGSMVKEAQMQRQDAARIGKLDESEVASVAFMGYEAPQDTLSGKYQVIQDDMAVTGAPLVADELRRIEAVNQNPNLHLVANGHSYGSSTLGIGLQELANDGPTPVDEAVFYGSPGIPDQSPKQSGPLSFSNPEPEDLGVQEGRAYNMAARTDPVVEDNLGAFVLGPSPEGYGAIPLSTSDEYLEIPAEDGSGTESIKTEGAPLFKGTHSSYPREGRTSAYILAAILSGRL